jgi:hypothetical protein
VSFIRVWEKHCAWCAYFTFYDRSEPLCFLTIFSFSFLFEFFSFYYLLITRSLLLLLLLFDFLFLLFIYYFLSFCYAEPHLIGQLPTAYYPSLL